MAAGLNGGEYTIDRVHHGERLVSNLSVSLIGGLQPDRLAQLRDLTSDGLLQRFLPVVLQPGQRSVDEPAGGAHGAYSRLINNLLELQPSQLSLDDGGYREFNLLLDELADLEAACGGLAPGFQGFVGKLAGLSGSIALVLHLAGDPTLGPTRQVGTNTMAAVREIIMEFAVAHALEFYRTAETSTDGDRLRRLASYVLTSGKTRILASDLTSGVAGFRGLGLGEVNARVAPLVAAAWLSPEGRDSVARAWTVEPAVAKQFQERRQIEERRKTALAKLMNAPRRAVSR